VCRLTSLKTIYTHVSSAQALMLLDRQMSDVTGIIGNEVAVVFALVTSAAVTL